MGVSNLFLNMYSYINNRNKLFSKIMVYKLSTETAWVKNRSNYNAARHTASKHVQYVMSFAKHCSCAVTIYGRQKTETLTAVSSKVSLNHWVITTKSLQVLVTVLIIKVLWSFHIRSPTWSTNTSFRSFCPCSMR
jgi:hypothetical protein